MDLKYTPDQRREYLNMIDRIGQSWMMVFSGNPEFYSAAYWDLFAGIWNQDRPVRKTDAIKFLKGVKSPQTAAKYLETSIEHKLLIEQDNPADARSKLVTLSPAIRQRLDAFFDGAVDEVRKTNNIVEAKGPVPEVLH